MKTTLNQVKSIVSRPRTWLFAALLAGFVVAGFSSCTTSRYGCKMNQGMAGYR